MSLRDTTPATLDTDAPRPPRRWRRRLRRLIYLAAVLTIAIVLGLLGVSQTSWFRDWLRRDIIVRAERLLDAKVSIARVGGDLLTGIVLDGVRLEQAGAPVITIDRVRVTYRVLTLRRTHIVLDSIDVLRPVVVARQTPEGWTFARLVKPRVKPTGSAPIVFAIDALHIFDGRVLVQPLAPAAPTRVEDLDASLTISTGPAGARVEMRAVSMTLPDRALRIGRLVGTVEKHGDVVSITNTGLDLPRSHLRVDGNVHGVGSATDLEFKVSSGAFAFDEMARLIPWVPARPVQAAFSASVRGPLSKLATTIAFRSPAGDAVGDVVVGREGDDVARPIEFRGTLDLAHIDPGVWSNTPAVAGRVAGHAVFTFAPPAASRGLPARGTFTLTRTDASVAGYEARGAEAHGRFDGPRVTLQRARGQAYGGRFDTRGTIGPRDPGEKGVRFDLTGRVDDIDVRRLPPPVPRLRLATDVAGTFHATLDGPAFDATMTFDASTVEGGRVRAGSIGSFALAPGVIRYGARARLEDLDLGRLGASLDVAWLQDPRIAGPMTGAVDVQAQGRTLAELSLNAHAVLDRATAAGGVATATTLDARIANRRLDVDVDGDVAHVDPAVATTVASAAGDVSGHVKGHVSVDNLGDTPTAEAFGFDGDVTLGPSRVAGRDITSATMTLQLAGGVLGVQRLEAATPLGAVTASGPLALNETAPSDLAYTIRGIPLTQFREQIGEATGTVDVDGRLFGPQATLRTEGTARFAGVAAGGVAQGFEGTAPFSVDLPDWDVAHLRLDVHPVLTAGAVGDTVLDTGDARIGYAGDRATFDVNASSGDRRVHAAGTADLVHAGRAAHHADVGGPVDRRADVGARRGATAGDRRAAERGADPRRALRRRHRPDRRGGRHAGAAGARRIQPPGVGPRPRPAADRGAGRAGEPRVRRPAERRRARHRHRGEAGRAGLVRHHARPLSRAAVRARRRRGPLRRSAPRRRRRRRAGARGHDGRQRQRPAGAVHEQRHDRRGRRPGRRRLGPDRPQHRELVDRPADRHRPDDGHRAGDRDRDGEAARHRHRRQPAVRWRRDPPGWRVLRAGDGTPLHRSGDAHHVRAGPDEGRRPSDARRGRRCPAGQRRPRPAPAGVRRRPDARPGTALRLRPQRTGPPRGRSRSRRGRAGDAPDDHGLGRDRAGPRRGGPRPGFAGPRPHAGRRRTMASRSSARGRSPCRRRRPRQIR